MKFGPILHISLSYVGKNKNDFTYRRIKPIWLSLFNEMYRLMMAWIRIILITVKDKGKSQRNSRNFKYTNTVNLVFD